MPVNVVLRGTKGAMLTMQEMDNNFSALAAGVNANETSISGLSTQLSSLQSQVNQNGISSLLEDYAIGSYLLIQYQLGNQLSNMPTLNSVIDTAKCYVGPESPALLSLTGSWKFRGHLGLSHVEEGLNGSALQMLDFLQDSSFKYYINALI